jgi:hypothetical protein
VTAIVINLDAHRLRLATAEHADAARRAAAMAARRARAEQRSPVTLNEVERLIDRLIEDLGELELLRERLQQEPKTS